MTNTLRLAAICLLTMGGVFIFGHNDVFVGVLAIIAGVISSVLAVILEEIEVDDE